MATPLITPENMNHHLKNMQFPWPSPVVSRGNDMEYEVQQGLKQYPFGEVIHAHAGDPQGMGQKPITFFQQVMALCLNPYLLDLNNFPSDVMGRAKEVLNGCKGNTVGAYSDSAGSETIRRQVARFIEERDGVKSNFQDIFLSSGATDAVRTILSMVNASEDETLPAGVMIPIPQYPLFSATLTEYNMYEIDYYLDESNEWAVDVNELRRAVAEAKTVCTPRVLVVINPGNPSGYVLNRSEIEEIVRFAYEESLFILADEVYQYNVYATGAEFLSFKRVMAEMGDPYDQMELASFMSGSKGYMGECGARSGYCEVINLDPAVKKMLFKFLSSKMCPTILGQAVMNCITNTPKPGEPSYNTFVKEKTSILNSLRDRAEFVHKAFNSVKGITCNKIVGAMYAYPRVLLPQKVVDIAKELGQPPDEYYAMEMLEKSGVCVIPGCLFGQRPGTYHFRLTFLPQMPKLEEILRRIIKFHVQFMKDYS